jgi:hypothetical protein
MTSNISSRICELIIGSQNWTKWISFDSGIILGYPEYEMGKGLMPVTGSINLKISQYDSTVPSSPNPRLNPSQWKRGQLITVRVANTSGTLTYLPCSGQALYLLKTPQKPKRNMEGILELSLEVGCRLALENFPPEPNQDISGITAGTALNRSVIIGNILTYIGVSNSISSMPYPIPYPLPKQTGNFISFAGAIADSAGYYLRCNSAGTVISEPITAIYSSSPVASYTIGTDERSWDSIGDIAEQPVEKLIVTGTVKDITIVDRSPVTVIEKQTAGVLYPDLDFGKQNPTAQIVSKITITNTEKTNTFFSATVYIQETAGVLYPDLAFGKQNPSASIASKITTNTYTFANGIVVSQNIVERQTAGVLYPDLVFGQQNPTAQIVSKLEYYTWVNIASQKWIKTYLIYETAGKLYPEIPFGQQNPSALVLSQSKTEPNDTSGPPTNIGEISINNANETQLKAEVFAQQLADDPYRPRQRTIDLPYTVEQAQLVDYGARFNRILSGRANGQQFAGVITNTALSSTFKPFAEVAIADFGITYHLKLDCIKWGLNGTEAWLVFNGIEMAVEY